MLSNRARACKLCGDLHRLPGEHCLKCHNLMTKPLGHGKAFLRDVRQSYVYAIGVEGDDTSAVKFGFTKTPIERLQSIQTGSPVRLAIIASDFGARPHEKAIHIRLASDRLHGEWFRRSAMAIEVIEAMREGIISSLLGVQSAKNKKEVPIILLGTEATIP